MPDIRLEIQPEIKVPKGAAVNEKSLANLRPWKPGQVANPYGSNGKKPRLLSDAYRIHLSARVPKEVAKALGIPDTWKWADAIASQILKKAVGQVSDKEINFTAITELRESTEGRNVERPSLGQSNTELTALMSAIAAGPIEAPIIDAEVSEPEPVTPEVVEPEYEDEPEVIDYNQDDKPIVEG
jgi:hypothetical protein